MFRLLWWLGLALSCVRADAVDTLYPDLKDPAVVHKPGYNATMMGHRRETRLYPAAPGAHPASLPPDWLAKKPGVS